MDGNFLMTDIESITSYTQLSNRSTFAHGFRSMLSLSVGEDALSYRYYQGAHGQH